MIRIGSSSWTAPGWNKLFYPAKLANRDQITHYATRFDTVEIDATFYAIPARSTVLGWKSRTPDNFIFAAKVPQIITHEKLLEDCFAELDAFCETISLLDEKLGPILFQFRYFRRGEITCQQFVEKLKPVIHRVPQRIPVAVEVRNKAWHEPTLINALKDRGAALTLIDHPYMPIAGQYLSRIESLITADFSYIRFLGDRLKTEQLIEKLLGELTFERAVIDRARELSEWSKVVDHLRKRKISVYAYFNNHFSGYAPDDIERFRSLVAKR